MTTYQNVRKRTMNVFGFVLITPRDVARAERKTRPTANAASERGLDTAIRRIGAMRTMAIRRMVDANFHQTKLDFNRGAANMNPTVPERFSRVDMSATRIAAAANPTGRTTRMKPSRVVASVAMASPATI